MRVAGIVGGVLLFIGLFPTPGLAQLEACCLPAGWGCVEMDPEDCLAQDGWLPGYPSCEPGICGEPVAEACCIGIEGYCVEVPWDVCRAQGGIPYGSPHCYQCLCPEMMTRACCLPDYSCVEVHCRDCISLGGWLAGDFCGSEICGQPITGACCLHSVCSIRTPADCAATGGAYKGDGTTCEPNSCLCPGDANCDGRVTFADIDPFVEALGGESAWNVNHPDCPWVNADCSGDLSVTFADIDPFVAVIGTTCP